MTFAHTPCVLVVESDENLAHKLAFDLKEATKIICGSARSMGIEVKE